MKSIYDRGYDDSAEKEKESLENSREQKSILEALNAKMMEISSRIDTLDFADQDGNPIGQESAAEIFDRPDVTIREYFALEFRNLNAGVESVTDEDEAEEMSDKYESLILQMEQVLNPVKFVDDVLKIISENIKLAETVERHIDMTEPFNNTLSNLELDVPELNIYLARKKLKVSDETAKIIAEINTRLKSLFLPLIHLI